MSGVSRGGAMCWKGSRKVREGARKGHSALRDGALKPLEWYPFALGSGSGIDRYCLTLLMMVKN